MSAKAKPKAKPAPERVAGEVVDGQPMPEAAEEIEAFLPSGADLVLHDPADTHETLVVLDAHDVRMIVQRAQSSALKKWVYEFPGDGGMKRGLSVDAVQDITQQMNWTGKCRITALPETLEVERIVEDIGNGPEPLWSATIFARDEVTGQAQSGSSMEPVMMQLTAKTAKKWRDKGKRVPEDNRVFDVFSRTKAINKAERNAQGKFIPEELEQTIIAMFENDPSRVERIRTEAEAAIEELPPPLDDDEAKALIAKARAAYDEIEWPSARVEFPPRMFAEYLLRSQHSHDRLRDFVTYVEGRRDELRAKHGPKDGGS